MKRQLRVQRQKSYYKVKLNKETGRYVYKIVALKEIIENQQKYGFKPLKISFPAHKTITVKEPIEDLNAFASEHSTTLDLLKEFNPWIKGSSLTIDKKYTIKIPKRKTKVKKESNEKVILDSIQPTEFKEDNIKEAVEKAEEEAKKTLYLETPEDTTLGS